MCPSLSTTAICRHMQGTIAAALIVTLCAVVWQSAVQEHHCRVKLCYRGCVRCLCARTPTLPNKAKRRHERRNADQTLCAGAYVSLNALCRHTSPTQLCPNAKRVM